MGLPSKTSQSRQDVEPNPRRGKFLEKRRLPNCLFGRKENPCVEVTFGGRDRFSTSLRGSCGNSGRAYQPAPRGFSVYPLVRLIRLRVSWYRRAVFSPSILRFGLSCHLFSRFLLLVNYIRISNVDNILAPRDLSYGF